MPGNELGDRVHNFFAQENSSQGLQHQSPVLEGNWPVLNNNYWVGSPRQIDVPNSSSKSYPSQNSEIDRGQGSYPVHVLHGLNFYQSNVRTDANKSQYSNGVVCGNQFHQNRQNEENFLSPDMGSHQHHLLSRRGLSILEAQESSHKQEKASDRSETSIAPVSLDLFDSLPQMNHQHASMLQALQHQQSGLNDMQKMQQQIMMRKIQEFQMQQQLKQFDLRPQDLINQVPAFAKQTSASQSNGVHDTSNSDTLQYQWTAEPGTNWLKGSSAMQGSSSGLVTPQNMAQAQRLMDFMPQPADQSLYGVPVSSSRGLTAMQYPQMVTSRSSIPRLEAFGNSLHGSQHNLLSDRIGVQESTPISRPKYQIENIGLASSQSPNTEIIDRRLHQQVNSMARNEPQQHYTGMKEPPAQLETSHERPTQQFSSSPSEAALNPTEEKILYGSDDNIWAAFGKSINMCGDGTDILVDNGGLSNAFPSIQSGSWSALMQSAVAETSSSDTGLQEESSGLNFHNKDGSSANQLTLVHNDYLKKASLPADDLQIPSTLNPGLVRSSEDINSGYSLGSNQFVPKFQHESGMRVLPNASQRFRESLDESGKWYKHNTLQKSVAEGNQIYENTSQHSLDAERTTEKVCATWVRGHTGTVSEENGWNSRAAVPAGGDGLNNNEAQLPQKLQNNRLMVMQDVHGSSLWKSNSPRSAIDFGSVKVGNDSADKGLLSLNHVSASVTNSCNMGVDDRNSSFVPNNNPLNQWTNAYPLAKFQGNDRLVTDQVMDSSNKSNKEEVRRVDMENLSVKENSSDSHCSNFSQLAFGGQRKAGLADASDSKSLRPMRQKSISQHASKISGPRKFQYHPMGNLDDAEPTSGLKMSMQLPSSSLQNTHFGQSSQVARYSAITDEGEHPKDNRWSSNEPTHGSFHGSASRISFPVSRPLDSFMLNQASSPSQNMLELLHKVDQSGNDGAVAHLSSSDCNVSPQPTEAEKSDGSAGHIQHYSMFKGFGLQLGPPSQRVHAPDLSLPSHNAQGVANTMHNKHAGAEMRDKMLQASSVQYMPFSNEGSQYENHRSVISDNLGDECSMYKVPGNYQLALDTPYARIQLQNKHIMKGSVKMAMVEQIDSSFSSNTLHASQRGSAEIVLPDATHSIQKQKHDAYGGIAGASDIQESSPAATETARDQIYSSQYVGMPCNSQQVFQNMWNNIPSSQHSLASQYPKVPSCLSVPHRSNIVELSHTDLHDSKGDHLSSGLSSIHANAQGVVDEEEHQLKERAEQVGNMDSTLKVEESPGKTSSTKDNLEESPVNSASTQKDIEAFGRSLKPNAFSNKNCALINQMKALKDEQTDPSIRVSKRMKVPDNIFDVHKFHPEAGRQNHDNVGDMMGLGTGVSPKDSSIFRFPSSSDMMLRNAAPLGNMTSLDIMVAGRDASQNNCSSDCTTSGKAENHQVTSLMAPSWLNQYGHLKNGQMFPVYSVHNVTSLRPNELPSAVVKSSSIMDAPSLEENCPAASVGAYQVGSTPKSAPTLVTNEPLSPAHSLQLTVKGEHKLILKPQKRKTGTSELRHWQKEISDGSQKFLVLSVTEGDWSKSADRLTEKVQDDAELNEDGSPLVRSKRRLVLTTQLMQQLFRPPPASILSSDASSAYEGVICFASRVALGDACSTVSCSSDFSRRDRLDLRSMKGKLNGDPHFAKAIEELLGKARKLEDNFLRLHKNASILDLRVEYQELEKFSVINRFARFHGRSQNNNPNASSVAATATTSNLDMQRYVLAVPGPRNLPDVVQCLSL